MCEFCAKHADGGRWYVEARNYSDDLVADARRRALIRDIGGAAVSEKAAERLRAQFAKMGRIASLPRVARGLVSWYVTRTMKRDHFGQVVPIEDVARILDLVNGIVRLPCLCRRTLRGAEQSYCIGISVKPDFGRLGEILSESFDDGPDLSAFERLTRDDAFRLMRSWEPEGLVHTVWTFGTPFVGGICNCDRSDCMAMLSTMGVGVKVMFRAEFVASVDPDLCTGCRACMRVCQFGAIAYSAGQKKASVDLSRCYGCGVCRSVCPEGAIELEERANVPEVAALW